MDWMCLRDFDQITFTYTLIMCYLQTEYVLHDMKKVCGGVWLYSVV